MYHLLPIHDKIQSSLTQGIVKTLHDVQVINYIVISFWPSKPIVSINLTCVGISIETRSDANINFFQGTEK